MQCLPCAGSDDSCHTRDYISERAFRRRMEFEVICNWHELPPTALQLLQSQDRLRPFGGHRWYSTYTKNIRKDAKGRPLKERWLLLSQNGVALLLLPMQETTTDGHRKLTSLSNYYTPYFSYLSNEKADNSASSPALLSTFFEFSASYLNGFDSIDFRPLTSTAAKELNQALGKLRFSSSQEIHTFNWRAIHINSFEEYWSQRESKLKNTVIRKQRKIDKVGSAKFSIASSHTLESSIEDYLKIYNKSWKPSENYPEFVPELARVFQRSSMLRMGLIHLDDKPIAAQVWIVCANTAYIYKLAYDPEHSQYSAGTLLTYNLLQHVIENDGVDTVDFLTGDDPYKSQWMTHRRPLYALKIANPRRFQGARVALTQKLKSVFRGG